MKLKKIVSLALAGVLAVSMLAGCSVKAPETKPTEPTAYETVASELTKAVDNKNITFTYDAALQTNLQTAVTAAAGTVGSVEGYLKNIVGADYVNTDMSKLNGLKASASTSDKNGAQTAVYVYSTKNEMTTAAMMKAVASQLTALDSAKTEATAYNVDFTYSYTGKVASVKVADEDGNYTTYVAVLVSCTTTGTVQTAE